MSRTKTAKNQVAPRKMTSKVCWRAPTPLSLKTASTTSDSLGEGEAERSSALPLALRGRYLANSGCGAGPDRLAVGALDVVLPGVLDQTDDARGHRDIVEVLGQLGAVGVGPREEIEHGLGRRGVVLLLVDQDKTRGRDRPAVLAGLIRQEQGVAGCALPIRVRRRRLEARSGRRHEVAFLVGHQRVRHLVLQGIGVFDVADRACRL